MRGIFGAIAILILFVASPSLSVEASRISPVEVLVGAGTFSCEGQESGLSSLVGVYGMVIFDGGYFFVAAGDPIDGGLVAQTSAYLPVLEQGVAGGIFCGPLDPEFTVQSLEVQHDCEAGTAVVVATTADTIARFELQAGACSYPTGTEQPSLPALAPPGFSDPSVMPEAVLSFLDLSAVTPVAPNEGERLWAESQCAGFVPIATIDDDGDGTPNVLDDDDDCDYIADSLELQIGGSPVLRDSDGDGVWDGGDLLPTVKAGVTLTLSANGLTSLNDMDGCSLVSCAMTPGDPYINIAGLRLCDSCAFITLTFPGLNHAEHPSNMNTVPATFFNGKQTTLKLPENILEYALESANSFPRIQLRVNAFDADKGQDDKLNSDDKIDLSSATGQNDVADVLFTLYQLKQAATQVLSFDGESDGSPGASSATLQTKVTTSASACAIAAAAGVVRTHAIQYAC